MKKIRSILLITLLFPIKLMSQSIIWENYQFNGLSLNPAMAGLNGHFTLTGILGNQFTSSLLPNQVSQVVVLQGVNKKASDFSYGFQGFNARLASYTNTGMDFSYAYRKQFDNFNFSVGAKGGFLVQPNLLVNNALNMVSLYAGLGVTLAGENAYFSVSKPNWLQNVNRVVDGKKPLFVHAGAFLGNPENVMLSTSALLELNKNQQIGNGININTKVWLAERAGLGVSYRLKGQTGFSNLENRWVLSAEYQFSTSLRIGITYDTEPLQNYNISSNNLTNRLFQLLIKFDTFGDTQTTNKYDFL